MPAKKERIVRVAFDDDVVSALASPPPFHYTAKEGEKKFFLRVKSSSKVTPFFLSDICQSPNL